MISLSPFKSLVYDMGIYSKEIAIKLRLLRESRGVTNKEIAKAIGKSEQTVSGYMSKADPKTVPTDVLVELSRFFNVEMSYFFGESNEEKASSDKILNIARMIEELSSENREFVVNLIKRLLN